MNKEKILFIPKNKLPAILRPTLHGPFELPPLEEMEMKGKKEMKGGRKDVRSIRKP